MSLDERIDWSQRDDVQDDVYSAETFRSMFNQGEAGVCYIMAVLLCLWSAAKAVCRDVPTPSLPHLVDHCRAPYFFAGGCGGGNEGEVLRCVQTHRLVDVIDYHRCWVPGRCLDHHVWDVNYPDHFKKPGPSFRIPRPCFPRFGYKRLPLRHDAFQRALRIAPIPFKFYLTNVGGFSAKLDYPVPFTDFEKERPKECGEGGWHVMAIVGSSPGKPQDNLAALDEPHYIARNSYGINCNHNGLLYIRKSDLMGKVEQTWRIWIVNETCGPAELSRLCFPI